MSQAVNLSISKPLSKPVDGSFAPDPVKADFVILFRVPSKDSPKASEQLEKLIRYLDRVGLEVECRHGGKGTVFIFVRCHQEKVKAEVYKSRVSEWLHGVRLAAPDEQTRLALDEEVITDAERLRVVYLLITSPEREGGAGITPGLDGWSYVDSIFPLHDSKFNREWIQNWSRKWAVSEEELDTVRDHFGEKLAFYFAYTQHYFLSLVPLAVLGVTSHFFLPPFNPLYAICLMVWTMVFKHTWERRERDLAVRWGVRGFTTLVEQRRAAYVTEGEKIDPVTGERRGWFPLWKRIARGTLQIPFGMAAGIILAAVLTLIFSVEVFMSEVYNGPFKQFLVFTPTVLFSTMIPTFSGIYTKISKSLTNFENHRTDQGFENALTQKIFVLNFLTGYMSLFLTAYVYVPFGNWIVPKLDIFEVALPAAIDKTEDLTPHAYSINAFRLKRQLIYFAVTAQIVGFAMENFLPYVTRKVFSEARKITNKEGEDVSVYDREEEKPYLERVREESELPEYDIYTDYAEMVVQYGYVALWSVIWPITPLCAVLNNWLELRSDAVKLCLSQRRPVPQRADSIGPWLNNITFLSWLGTLTTSTLVYLFQGGDFNLQCDKTMVISLLVTVLVAEHGYWVLDRAIGALSRRIQTSGEINVRKEEFSVRRRYLQTVGLSGPQGLSGNASEARRERALGEDRIGFWGEKGVEGSVVEGRDILSRGWEKRKVQ